MAINKVVYGNTTLLDLSQDTVASAADIVAGKTGHLRDGTKVTGTASGGGSSKNIQVYSGYDEVNATTYTATDVTIKVAKTGTYNISWMGWRTTTSGTNGSQLYKNGTAVGNASTTFIRNYGQFVQLTNQSLNVNDVLVVRARARNSSYYMCVGNLIIEEVE